MKCIRYTQLTCSLYLTQLLVDTFANSIDNIFSKVGTIKKIIVFKTFGSTTNYLQKLKLRRTSFTQNHFFDNEIDTATYPSLFIARPQSLALFHLCCVEWKRNFYSLPTQTTDKKLYYHFLNIFFYNSLQYIYVDTYISYTID